MVMTRYRVTLRTTTVEIIAAENPYQAAVVASARHRGDVEVTQVAPAVGRPASTKGRSRAVKKQAAKKVPAKKKRQLSPQTRAKLAQNLAKARAARAAKRTAAAKKKRSTKNR
jgi:hypothetical protein